MNESETLINFLQSTKPVRVIGGGTKGIPLDLSPSNIELQHVDVSNSASFSVYVNSLIEQNNADFAWGGYLEKRSIYKRSTVFNDDSVPERNIHLGIDLWCKAETSVFAALDGVIHSFQNNEAWGDYGPTIILEHRIEGSTFYSLYGHLAAESLDGITTGQKVQKGEQIAILGDAAVNGDYPPHLHFQLIRDLQGKKGDYPGVCAKSEVEYYQKNCPNPNLLLGLV